MTEAVDRLAEVPTSTVASGPLADLILVRLLPEKKSLSAKKIRTDLTPFFARQPSTEEIHDSLLALRGLGLLAKSRGNAIGDAGKARARVFLGMAEGAAKISWATIQSGYLLPKALGLEPGSVEAKSLAASKTLVPRLLKRELRLPAGTGDSIAAALEAFVCQQLGFPDQNQLSAVFGIICGRANGSAEGMSKDEAARVLPGKLLGLGDSKATAVRCSLIRRLTTEPHSIPPAVVELPDEPFDLEAFSNTVKAVARTSPTGRFGTNKVFISHIWRQLLSEPRFARMGLDGFKKKLVEANRADLLTLSRADLVQVMNADDVRESETRYLNATFHFVLVEKE